MLLHFTNMYILNIKEKKYVAHPGVWPGFREGGGGPLKIELEC